MRVLLISDGDGEPIQIPSTSGRYSGLTHAAAHWPPVRPAPWQTRHPDGATILPLWLGMAQQGTRVRFVLPIVLVGLISLLFVWQADGWAYFSEGRRFTVGVILGIILVYH